MVQLERPLIGEGKTNFKKRQQWTCPVVLCQKWVRLQVNEFLRIITCCIIHTTVEGREKHSSDFWNLKIALKTFYTAVLTWLSTCGGNQLILWLPFMLGWVILVWHERSENFLRKAFSALYISYTKYILGCHPVVIIPVLGCHVLSSHWIAESGLPSPWPFLALCLDWTTWRWSDSLFQPIQSHSQKAKHFLWWNAFALKLTVLVIASTIWFSYKTQHFLMYNTMQTCSFLHRVILPCILFKSPTLFPINICCHTCQLAQFQL